MPENHNPLPPLTLTAAAAAAAMNKRNGVEEDHFERLPDALILEIFRKVSHGKYLLRCFAVRKRFASLIPQTHRVVWSVHTASSPSQIIDHHAPRSVLFDVMKFTWVRSLRIEFISELGDYGPSMEFLTVMGARFKIAVFIMGKVFHKIQGFNINAADLQLLATIGCSYDNDIKEEALKVTKTSLLAALNQHRIAQILTCGLPGLCELVFINEGVAKLCMGKEEVVELRNKMSEAAESELPMSEVIGGDGVVGVRLWHGPVLLDLPSSGRLMEGAMVIVVKPEVEEIEMERDIGCILGAVGRRDNEDDDYNKEEHGGKLFDEMVNILMKHKFLSNPNQDEAFFQTHRLQVFED